jgi:aminoglycoside 3-N-acetyltransferase I
VSDRYVFRRLNARDLPAMRALLNVFAIAFDEPETYGSHPPDDTELARRLGKADTVVIAAETEDGEVVGGLVAYVLDKFERPRNEIYIYDLAVASEHRRKGLARRAIAHLQSLAPALGVWVIFVQADPQDAPALALYRSIGTEERVHHFAIAVRGGTTSCLPAQPRFAS